MKLIYTIIFLSIFNLGSFAYTDSAIAVVITVVAENRPIQAATITINGIKKPILTDEQGKAKLRFTNEGNYAVIVSAVGYFTEKTTLQINKSHPKEITITLQSKKNELESVVVTGTLKPILSSASPVPIEIFTPQFFRKNPAPSIFDALQNVNGVRPQLNCNICNTGDIHINGLEGPYTMITIDGMPIVSSLSTVYGLSGIPNSLVERIEIVKGPASSLYGSEAVGGLINIITKTPAKSAVFAADVLTNSYLENNVDLSAKWKAGNKLTSLTGLQYFHFNHKVDNNKDNFTDVTLQQRISFFNKLNWERKNQKVASLAMRYLYEDRWGGEMQWNKQWRGSDSIYGESIYTDRVEVIGRYDLPFKEKMSLTGSYNYHRQNSYYGTSAFMATQHIGFTQLTWDKQITKNWNLLAGTAFRLNHYDDNTTATIDTLNQKNQPDKIIIPGIFLQQEISYKPDQLLLIGLRYDYDKRHGNIFTPRIAWKKTFANADIIRMNAGTGFRVVNLFTEDHAALTGARKVIIKEKLKPEQSYNINLSYNKKFRFNNTILNVDAAVWYTYFTNQIIPDYTTNVNQIIYQNLDGHAVSKGLTINTDWNFGSRLKLLTGVTFMNVYKQEKDVHTNTQIKSRPLLTERFTGTWSLSYTLNKTVDIDYTGNIYGSMLLPTLGPLDPRRPISPVWSIQNIQVTKKINTKSSIYLGVKNLLNWTPNRGNPFIIARANDPFDKQVLFDNNGVVIPTAENPYGLTFDPNYVYGPNLGRRIFAGFRYSFR